jgi:hypothetical protein
MPQLTNPSTIDLGAGVHPASLAKDWPPLSLGGFLLGICGGCPHAPDFLGQKLGQKINLDSEKTTISEFQD